MHVHLHRIGGHRLSGGRDVGRAVGQTAGRGQWIRRTADGVIGDAAARVPVPGSGADAAGRRDIHQLVVGGAVGVRARTGRSALAGKGRGRTHLARLPKGHGDARGRGLQCDRGHIRDFHPVTQAIAIVSAWVADAAGDRNPGWNGQAQQANKRQEPPHESSPPRLVELRNGHSRYHRGKLGYRELPIASARVCRWRVALSSGLPSDRSWSLGWK